MQPWVKKHTRNKSKIFKIHEAIYSKSEIALDSYTEILKISSSRQSHSQICEIAGNFFKDTAIAFEIC